MNDPKESITISLDREDAKTINGLLGILARHRPVERDADLTHALSVGLVCALHTEVALAEHRPRAAAAIKIFKCGVPLSGLELESVCFLSNRGDPDAKIAASDLMRFKRSMAKTRPNT